MNRLYEITRYGNTFHVSFIKDTYMGNGNLYLGLVTDEGEPYADLTTNLEMMCKPNWACIDTNNLGDDILEWLEKIGAGKVMQGRSIASGYCRYPMFEFSNKFLDGIKEEEK